MKIEKPNKLAVFLAALTSSAFFTLIIPVQTYLANRNLFTFGWRELSIELAVVFVASLSCIWVVIGAVSWLAGKLKASFVATLLMAVVFALTFCAYLETGILAQGLPPLDGDMSNLENAYQKVVDTIVLGCAFSAGVALTLMFSRYIAFFFLGLLVMSIASVFDVRVAETMKSACEMSDGFCDKYVVAKSTEFSKERNVLVFILDSTPATIAADVVSDNPELYGKFSGFTAYRNNITMHECTERGLPALMTGRYLEKDGASVDFSMSQFGSDSFLYSYFKSGVPIYFMGDLMQFGYTNRPKPQPAQRDVGDSCFVILRKYGNLPSLSLYEVVKFRIAPYAMKEGVLRIAVFAGLKYKYVGKEEVLFPILEQCEYADAPLVLGVYHTRGIHVPIYYDKDGKKFPDDVPQSQRLEGGAYLLFSQLGAFFDELKVRGVYDNSTIIVTTDHGIAVIDHPEGEMGQKSAMLWVKPEGATYPFRVSEMPTSHSRISELVKALRTTSLSQSEMDAILHQEIRVFRGRPKKTFLFYDWVYDADGNLIEKKDLGVFKCK